MGLFSSKKLTLPDPPSFFQDPYVGLSEGALYGQGSMLTSPTVEGLPEILRDTVSTSPEITQLVLQGLRSSLAGDLRTSRQNIINDLEANNQLTGSTTASALGNLETDYLNTLTAAGAEAGIADINRALENRIRIYSTGLGATEAAGTLGLNNQSQRNEFNLANYENLVSKTLAEQKASKGGLVGALTGGAGGIMAGLALAPFTGGGSLIPALAGGLGALAGGMGPAGTGGSILSAGAGLKGSSMIGGGLRNANVLTSGNGEAISDVLKIKGAMGIPGGAWANIYGGLN